MPEEVTEQGQDQGTQEPSGVDAFNSKWDEVMGQHQDPPLVDPTPTTPEPEAEEKADQKETAESDASANEPDATADPDSDPAVQIDPSLVLLAEELDVDKAALDELIQSDPEQANILLTKLSEEHLALTSRTLFGTDNTSTGVVDRGRLQPGTSEAEADSKEEQKLGPLETLFADEEATAKFREEHGEVLTDILKAELEDRQAFRKDNADLKELRESLIAQQQQVILEEVESTFKSFGKTYADFYGSEVPFEKRSEAQNDNRGRVGDMAENLRSGDILKGASVKSDRYYLLAAHNHVAAELRSKAARQQILDQLQNRATTITNKPSAHRVTNIAAGRSDEAAHNALDRKVAELGIEHIFPD